MARSKSPVPRTGRRQPARRADDTPISLYIWCIALFVVIVAELPFVWLIPSLFAGWLADNVHANSFKTSGADTVHRASQNDGDTLGTENRALQMQVNQIPDEDLLASVGYKELPIEPKAAVYTFAFGVFLINALGLPQLECGGLLTAVCWLWHNRLEKALLRDQAVLRDQALAKARAKALAEAREKKECDKNRMVTSIANKTEFDALLKASKVVIVDFYATWCPPCKIAAPEFAKVRGRLFHFSFLSCTRVLSPRPSLSLSLSLARALSPLSSLSFLSARCTCDR